MRIEIPVGTLIHLATADSRPVPTTEVIVAEITHVVGNMFQRVFFKHAGQSFYFIHERSASEESEMRVFQVIW